MKVYGNYFYGNKISDYGIENGYVDYGTLAKAFDGVLNNDIMNKTYCIGDWEQESGFIDNSKKIEELQEKVDELEEQVDELEEYKEVVKEERIEEVENKIETIKEEIEELELQIEEYEYEQECGLEVFQWYIVDDNGARILKDIDEIVYYNEELDMYLWGVTHYGTSWSYVLTDIKIEHHN